MEIVLRAGIGKGRSRGIKLNQNFTQDIHLHIATFQNNKKSKTTLQIVASFKTIRFLIILIFSWQVERILRV